MALHHSPSIVTNGLSLYLDAANAKSYTGSGTTWSNIMGGVPFHTGTGTVSGYSISYNGGLSTGGESITDSYPFSLTTSNTIQIGMRSTKLGDSSSNCGDKRTTLWSKQFSTWYGHTCYIVPQGSNPDASTGTLAYSVYGTTTSSAQISTNIGVNTFYDVTTQYIPSSSFFYIKMFINGNLISTSASTPLTTVANEVFRIGGRDNNCSNGSFIGNIFYVRLYNRELTVSEIRQNFNSIRGRFGV